MNIGILGGGQLGWMTILEGQLGWMTILEGRKFGFKFFVLDKSPNAPASRVADGWFPPEKVEDFLKVCDVITYEFEHIEEFVLEKLEGNVLPKVEVLRIKRNRGKEKDFIRGMFA